MEFNTVDFEPDLNRIVSWRSGIHAFLLYLVLQVIPPVWPGLFDTSLLFENSLLDYGTQNTECHSDTVVVVTVNADAGLEFWNGLSVNLEAII